MNYLNSAFLSFYIIGGGGGPQTTLKPPSYNPTEFIKLNTPIEIGLNRKEGVVSVKDFFVYKSVEVLGWQDVNNDVTSMYSVTAFENYTVKKEVVVTSSVSMSYTSKLDIEVTTKMSSEAHIFDVYKVKSETSFKYLYKIENCATYTNSITKSAEINYQINERVLEGKDRFKVGTVGYVYKLNGTCYQARDWWRDHHKIDQNSYVEFTNYIVCDPFITVLFDDGTFVI